MCACALAVAALVGLVGAQGNVPHAQAVETVTVTSVVYLPEMREPVVPLPPGLPTSGRFVALAQPR